MRKEEKTRLTYERILSAAIIEFGTKNYDSASLTALCNENQISKGLLYHNFKNKDDLYLKCVELCFQKMTAYFKERAYEGENVQEGMRKLFGIRERFFKENPHYCHIFFNAVIQPPEHLREEIHALRQQYDAFYTECFKNLLQHVELRDEITPEAAMQYFMIFLEMYNGYFQSRFGKEDIQTLMEDHEGNLSKILDIMLYGVAKEESGQEKAGGTKIWVK